MKNHVYSHWLRWFTLICFDWLLYHSLHQGQSKTTDKSVSTHMAIMAEQSSFVAKGSDLLPQFANVPDDTLCNVLDAISY